MATQSVEVLSAAISCTSLWCQIGSIINGEFFSALFGATAGAAVSYFVTTRHERRKDIRKEISACSAAIGLSATAASTAIRLKKQYIIGIRAQYEEEMQRLKEIEIQRQANRDLRIQFVYRFDFKDIQAPLTLVDELRKAIIDKVPSSTNTLVLVAQLEQVATALTRALQARSTAINLIRQKYEGPRTQAQEEDLAAWYFGLRSPLGHVDETYPDTLMAISAYADDVIYFSMLLAEVLNLHGRYLAMLLGRRAPKVAKWEWDASKLASLLPDRREYADFEKQFRGPKSRLRDHRLANRLRLLIMHRTPLRVRRVGKRLWRSVFKPKEVAKKNRALR